ncbi:MAG: histidine kinase [Rhodospirillales bacterium]|nr:histidine kinase [Rhodospirillales bacterium]
MDVLQSQAHRAFGSGREAERLALALQAAGFGEWELDLAGGAISGSPLYRALFGFPPDQPLTADDIHCRYHPEDREKVQRALGAMLAGRAPEVRGEYRLLMPNGTVRWISLFGRLFRNGTGAPIRAAGVVQDITLRKQAEHAVRQSEERFRVAVRAVAGVVYDWDLNSGEAFRSHGLEEIVGLPPETVPSTADWWSERIHPQDQARLAAVRADIKAGRITRYETEYRVRHEGGHWVHLWDRGAVLRDDFDRPVRVVGSAADVTQRKKAERALSESEERFRLAAGAVVGMVYDWDAETGRVFRSEGLYDIVGVRSDQAPADREWWWTRVHPEDVGNVAMRRAEILNGRLDRFEHEYRIQHENGNWVEILDRGAILRDENGRTTRIIGSVTDITQRKQAEERQSLLLAELDHRVKNMLAVVQSVVMQTRTSAQSLDGFTVSLEGRLHAMARTHSLLTQSRWEGARVDAIIGEELSPYSGNKGRVAIAGPDLVLRPKAAMALSLAIHELATNAAKYGSLSKPAGRVQVVWTVEEGCVRLVWSESDGPAVRPPSRRGFGIQAIEKILGYEVAGEARMEFEPSGLVCRIAMPVRQLAGLGEADESRVAAAAHAPKPLPGPDRRRILVVEDSALIAIEIEEAVRELGYEVLGPVARLSSAMEIAETQPVDGALLDINLDGIQVFPLADLLRERGVPFVFATGYDRRTVLPPRFGSVPTLAKPFSPSELARLLTATLKAA